MWLPTPTQFGIQEFQRAVRSHTGKNFDSVTAGRVFQQVLLIYLVQSHVRSHLRPEIE
jgi:hypothetical protein